MVKQRYPCIIERAVLIDSDKEGERAIGMVDERCGQALSIRLDVGEVAILEQTVLRQQREHEHRDKAPTKVEVLCEAHAHTRKRKTQRRALPVAIEKGR